MATWKAVERRVAAKVGGRRIGNTGKATPDVVSDRLVCEVKHRARLPAWLKGTLQNARKHADADHLGVLVLHEKGRHDSLVVMSLADFVQWFGEGDAGADPGGDLGSG